MQIQIFWSMCDNNMLSNHIKRDTENSYYSVKTIVKYNYTFNDTERC